MSQANQKSTRKTASKFNKNSSEKNIKFKSLSNSMRPCPRFLKKLTPRGLTAYRHICKRFPTPRVLTAFRYTR